MSKVLSSAFADALHVALPLDLGSTRERLEKSGGGVRILHASPGLEVRVEVLDAPGPGELRVEPADTLYSVLTGSGLLGVAHGDPRCRWRRGTRRSFPVGRGTCSSGIPS